MDGLLRGTSSDAHILSNYRLKLYCSDVLTKSNRQKPIIVGFLTALIFHYSISPMSMDQMSEKIWQISMQNKNALYIQKAFPIENGPLNDLIPRDAQVLKNWMVLV